MESPTDASAITERNAPSSTVSPSVRESITPQRSPPIVKIETESIFMSGDEESPFSESDDAGLEDNESNYDEFENWNRFSGPRSTFINWHANDLDLVDGIHAQEGQDLSSHLFLSSVFRLRRLRKGICSQPNSRPGSSSASEATQTSSDGSSLSRPQSDSEQIPASSRSRKYKRSKDPSLRLPRTKSADALYGGWLPSQKWTAWPMHPSIVPGPEENFLAGCADIGGPGSNHTDRILPNADLREEIIAILERFTRRKWQQRAGKAKVSSPSGTQNYDNIPDSDSDSEESDTSSSNDDHTDSSDSSDESGQNSNSPNGSDRSNGSLADANLTVDDELISRLMRPHAEDIITDTHNLVMSLVQPRYPISLLDEFDHIARSSRHDSSSSSDADSESDGSEADFDNFLSQLNKPPESLPGSSGSEYSSFESDTDDDDNPLPKPLGRPRKFPFRDRDLDGPTTRARALSQGHQSGEDGRASARSTLTLSVASTGSVSVPHSDISLSALKASTTSGSFKITTEPSDWKVVLRHASLIRLPQSVLDRARARLNHLFEDSHPPTIGVDESLPSLLSSKTWLGRSGFKQPHPNAGPVGAGVDGVSIVSKETRDASTADFQASIKVGDGFLEPVERFRGRIAGEANGWDGDGDPDLDEANNVRKKRKRSREDGPRTSQTDSSTVATLLSATNVDDERDLPVDD